MKASDLFVKCLENEGVEYIFGVPGEENLDLLESLRNSKIKYIITRHESGAAFMAATYGRLTGKAGVVSTTLGPGALNTLNGVAYAKAAGIPLVLITAQNGIRHNRKENDYQYVDIVNIFEPITKWNRSITAGQWTPKLIRKAFRIAQMERPGPTHLELPEDVAEEEVDDSFKPLPKIKVRRPAPDSKSIDQALEMLKNAKHPIILAAGGAMRNLVTKQLASFVEKSGIFVVHTPMGKGAFSDASEKSLFTIGIQARDYVNCGLDKADLVITIGYYSQEYYPRVWNPKKDKKIIHIDFTESEVDNYYYPECEIIGDISHSLWALGERVKETGIQKNWDFSYFEKLRKFLLDKYTQEMGSDDFPIKPQRIVKEIQDALDPDSILVHDNGMHKFWIARMYRCSEPNTVLVDNAFATMGGGLPGAIAAKMINPEKKVLSIVGDGGFGMSGMEFEVAVRLKLNVVVLVWVDNAYGMVKWHQEKSKGKFHTFGVDFLNPDFVKFAESFGGKGFRVKNTDDLKKYLREALSYKDTPVIIEIPVDYSENFKVFTEEIGSLVCF